MSQTATRRTIATSSKLKRRRIEDSFRQDYRIGKIYRMAALYAYQIPKQMLNTAANVCRC